MDAEKVLKLIDAGFSADEIRGMLSPSAEPKAEPKAEPEAKEEPKRAPEAPKEEPAKEPAKEDPIDSAMDEVQQKIAGFNTVMDSMIEKMSKMAGMPAIGSVQPKGIEDIISDFFKEEK
jgi:hypothetical protein